MARQKCLNNFLIFTRIFYKMFQTVELTVELKDSIEEEVSQNSCREYSELFTSFICKVVKVDGATNGRGSITGAIFGAKGQSMERQFLELFSSSRRGGRP